jgi:hypothetical protein
VDIGGKKISNWWLIGGAIGAGAVYLVIRHSSSASSTSGAASSSATDPVTGLPYSEDNSTDPVTGLTYLQEAQQYGSVQAAEEEVTSGSAFFGQSGTGNLVDTGLPTIDGVTGTSTNPSPGSFETNAQWAQAVTAGLADLGYNSTDVAAALGLYFQNHPLGTAPDGASYLSIVQAAVAEFGPPPVGSFQIVGAPTTSTGTGTGTGTTAGAKKPAGTPPGVKVTKTGARAIRVTWGAEGGEGGGAATSYNFGIDPAPRGESSAMHNIGNKLGYNVGNLVPGTTYQIHVQAQNSAGTGPVGTVSHRA